MTSIWSCDVFLGGTRGLVESLWRDLHQENSLGGERAGRIGEKGILWWGDCCSGDCWGGDYWGGDCWSCFGGDWFGDCYCHEVCTGGCCEVAFEGDFVFFCGGDAVSRIFFAFVSPKSLHLLRFVVVSICSCYSPSVFFLAFFLCFLLGDGAGCGAGCTVVISLAGFSIDCCCCWRWCFDCGCYCCC